MADRQLYRSRNALVGGVCAGIAERIDAEAIVVRIFAVLLALVTLGLSIVVYVVLWVRLPLEPEGPEPLEVMPEYAESNAFGAIAYRENGTLLESRTLDKSQPQGLPIVARLAVAVGLMLLFLVVSINISPLVPGTQWWQFWPIAFMIVGLCLMIVPKKHIASLDELQEEDAELISYLMLKVKDIAAQLGLADGYRVVTNNGEVINTAFNVNYLLKLIILYFQ